MTAPIRVTRAGIERWLVDLPHPELIRARDRFRARRRMALAVEDFAHDETWPLVERVLVLARLLRELDPDRAYLLAFDCAESLVDVLPEGDQDYFLALCALGREIVLGVRPGETLDDVWNLAMSAWSRETPVEDAVWTSLLDATGSVICAAEMEEVAEVDAEVAERARRETLQRLVAWLGSPFHATNRKHSRRDDVPI